MQNDEQVRKAFEQFLQQMQQQGMSWSPQTESYMGQQIGQRAGQMAGVQGAAQAGYQAGMAPSPQRPPQYGMIDAGPRRELQAPPQRPAFGGQGNDSVNGLMDRRRQAMQTGQQAGAQFGAMPGMKEGNMGRAISEAARAGYNPSQIRTMDYLAGRDGPMPQRSPQGIGNVAIPQPPPGSAPAMASPFHDTPPKTAKNAKKGERLSPGIYADGKGGWYRK